MNRKAHEKKLNQEKARKEAAKIAKEIEAKRNARPAWILKEIDRNQRLGFQC